MLKSGTPVDALVAERMGLGLSELTQEKTEEYQAAAFRKVLHYVKENSDFYRKRFSAIDPEEIRTLDDIRRIPCTCESDLAGNEWRFQCVSPSAVHRIVTIPTTGTRGKQKRLSFTKADQQKAVEFILRGYLTMECKKGERMLIFMSGGSPGSIGDLVRQAVEPVGMEIAVFGEIRDLFAAYERLMEYRPEIVEAIPWHAAALAAYGKQFGNPEKAFIRSVNLSADVVPDQITERLRRLWGCTVHRHYGSTEMCIFGGVECVHHNGYHLRHSDILYEIPEPDENGMGEIVITTMAHEAMPLIRYRTGDIGRMIDAPCPCGAKVRRLEKIWGRDSSILKINGTPVFLSELADVVYADDGVLDFDAETCENGRLRIILRSLPECKIDLTGIQSRLEKIAGAQSTGLDKSIIWETETFRGFPDGYNLKKTIR
ncbi:MAG: phenylacetate--CoA ligase family protein [Lachnospiraceae bacterium]|nr:phenylacetate--CoA ligase family protein [Lachnospiraceae bacterium]